MKGLAVGRIVHFYPPTQDDSLTEPQAAIVTRLCESDGFVDVTVFPEGLIVRQVPHSKQPKPYTWSWPPRVE